MNVELTVMYSHTNDSRWDLVLECYSWECVGCSFQAGARYTGLANRHQTGRGTRPRDVGSLLGGHHQQSNRRQTNTDSFSCHPVAKVKIARENVLFTHLFRPITTMPKFQHTVQQEQQLVFLYFICFER
jgi:hypothetical protein